MVYDSFSENVTARSCFDQRFSAPKLLAKAIAATKQSPNDFPLCLNLWSRTKTCLLLSSKLFKKKRFHSVWGSLHSTTVGQRGQKFARDSIISLACYRMKSCVLKVSESVQTTLIFLVHSLLSRVKSVVANLGKHFSKDLFKHNEKSMISTRRLDTAVQRS